MKLSEKSNKTPINANINNALTTLYAFPLKTPHRTNRRSHRCIGTNHASRNYWHKFFPIVFWLKSKPTMHKKHVFFPKLYTLLHYRYGKVSNPMFGFHTHDFLIKTRVNVMGCAARVTSRSRTFCDAYVWIDSVGSNISRDDKWILIFQNRWSDSWGTIRTDNCLACYQYIQIPMTDFLVLQKIDIWFLYENDSYFRIVFFNCQSLKQLFFRMLYLAFTLL